MPHHPVASLLRVFALTLSATALAGLDDQALLPPDSVSPVSILFERQYIEYRPGGNRVTQRGIAIATDATGNIYMASGASVAKYSPTGARLWEHTHENRVTIENSGGLTQNRYFETWDNNQTDLVPQGSSLDPGEQVSPYAQRVVLDAQGNVYANFLDTAHSDRSLVVKFSSDGTLIWRHITEFPFTTDNGFQWECRVLNMVVLPDQSGLALLEAVRTGSSANHRSRLVIFNSDTTRTDRNGEWRRKINYGGPRVGETESHHSSAVGLAVGSDAALYYATHDGPEKPSDAAEYPAEDTLVLRKLPSPYTSDDLTGIFPATQESWNDLAAGPDGRIYMGGNSTGSATATFHIVASFDPAALVRNWKTVIPGEDSDPEDARGSRIYVDATGVNVACGSREFPEDPNASRLSVSRVDLTGAVKWHHYQSLPFFGGSFGDAAGNLYLIGGPYFSSTFAFTLWKYSVTGDLQFLVQFASPTGRRYDWTNAVGLATNDGHLLVSMPDVSEDFSDRVVKAPLINLTNPAVVTPSTDDAPPAVVIKSVNARQQAGAFPYKFTIEVQVVEDRGIKNFSYRARVDGRDSGWVDYFVPPDGIIPFDVDCTIFAVSFKATDTGGQTSAVAGFVARRVGNTFPNPAIKNPPIPPNKVKADTTSGGVVLTWEDNSSNETGFIVQRKTKKKSGKFSPTSPTIGRLGPNVKTFTDKKAKSGKTYRYLVRSRGSGGMSAPVALDVLVP